MGQVDALRMVEHVKERLVDLAVSENHIRDENFINACRNVWSEGNNADGLVSELWVEGALPGLSSRDTLESLSEEGLFPKSLSSHIAGRNIFPIRRKLFNHQSETLRLCSTYNNEERPSP